MSRAGAMAEAIREGLRRDGFAHVRGPLDSAAYRGLAEAIGPIVAHERIALREGAHAYVAKPGRVPLHTDHPEVQTIGWLCEAQDDEDGASLLLDSKPVIDGLVAEDAQLLRQVHLKCPPLAGGPPTLSFPVLRATPRGLALFCSPWLQSAVPNLAHIDMLEVLRQRLSARSKTAVVSLRLQPGEALFINNERVLHGRGAISPSSRRQLHRVWLRGGATCQSQQGPSVIARQP